MKVLLQWMAENSEAVIAASTAVYMLLTAFMVMCTGWMAWEARKARQLQEQPQIDIFFKRGDDSGSKLYLAIRNNGFGAAYDVHLHLQEEFVTNMKPPFDKLSNQGPFKHGISFFPSGGQREMALGIYMGEDFNELIKKEIKVMLSYKNSFNECKDSEFSIAFSELENTARLPDNPLFEISGHLEKMSRKLNDIASGYKQLRVITQSKKEHDEANRQIVNQIKKSKEPLHQT